MGRRVVAQLRGRGLRVRAASRSGTPRFDLAEPDTWAPTLAGVRLLVLISPEGVPIQPGFLSAAAAAGVDRVTLLSDKAVDVMQVERLLAAERLVQDSALGWSIVRPDWFNQDFNESFFEPGILSGLIAVPIGEARQGFVDADDIAAVLVETLLDSRHVGRTYVVTGPTSLSFLEAVDRIGEACGRQVRFVGDVDSYRRGKEALGVDPARIQHEVDDFARLAAQGDSAPTDDVLRVTGRPAIPFDTFVSLAAAAGAWRTGGLSAR